MEPELIANYEEEAGEGPLWHVAEQRVYWVDITTSRIFRYHPASGRHELFYQGEEDIGGFTFQADGSLLLFMARGAIKVLRDGQLTTIIDEIPAERRTRFNDVIADPAGRVYCGTMPTDGDDARLYRLDTDGTLTVLLEGIGLSNGMGYTPRPPADVLHRYLPAQDLPVRLRPGDGRALRPARFPARARGR